MTAKYPPTLAQQRRCGGEAPARRRRRAVLSDGERTFLENRVLLILSTKRCGGRAPPRCRRRAVLLDGEPSWLQKLTTKPHGMLMHLKHMTCQLIFFSTHPNADNLVLQLARCLDIAPDWRSCIWIWYILTLMTVGVDEVDVAMIISRQST